MMVSKYCLDQKGLLLPQTGGKHSPKDDFYDSVLLKTLNSGWAGTVGGNLAHY